MVGNEIANCLPIHDEVLAALICYPSVNYECFKRRVQLLTLHGIKCVLNEGKVKLGNIRVLGKGHSAIIIKVVHDKYGVVALKLRRVDSKRDSLINECNLMRSARPISPVPYICCDDFIIMEFIDGVHIEDAIKYIKSCKEAIALIVKVLAASFWLDMAGIRHNELSLAGKHVMIEATGSVKIVDYESASFDKKPCNICSTFSWLIMRKRILEMFCNVGRDLIQQFIHLIRKYKLSNDLGERRKLFTTLVGELGKLLGD